MSILRRVSIAGVMLLACFLCYGVGLAQLGTDFPLFCIPLIPILLIGMVAQVGWRVIEAIVQMPNERGLQAEKSAAAK